MRAVLLVLLAIAGDWLLTWIADARSRIAPTALVALVAVGLALTWSATSHAAEGSWSTVAMAATTLHVVAMGVWLGGLVSLLTTLRSEPDASLARAFSKVAMGADADINACTLRRSVLLGAVGVTALLLLTTILIGTAPPRAAA